MGKMFNSLMMILAINIALILFSTGQPETGWYASHPLWKFLYLPTAWKTAALIISFGAMTVLVGAGQLYAGSLYHQKTDFTVYATFATIFLSFGFTLTSAWMLFRSGLVGLLLGKGTGAVLEAQAVQSANIISAIFVSPIILLYLMVLLDWWRGKD